MLGNGDGHFNPDNITVYGYNVAIKKFETDESIEHGGILLPESTVAGFKANKGEVLSVGIEAEKKYGIHIGDIVRFDQCSVLYDTNPVVVVDGGNVIIKMNGDTPVPLKDMVFVKKVSSLLQMENTQGIIIPDKNTDISIGIITAVDNESVVSVGEHIILTTNADVLKGPDGKYFCYHQDDILCVLEP